jgi:hypothetical protein
VATTQEPNFSLEETGPAGEGSTANEVVIGVAAGFGKRLNKSIKGVPHAVLLRELMAGLEEEDVPYRVIRVRHTSDLGVIGQTAAKYAGSGYGIGILSKGTSIIHNRDLAPLDNLELYSVSPLLSIENYRQIGRNAARYAKGDSPVPVIQPYDGEAIGATYMARAAVMHLTETRECTAGAAPLELEVSCE